MRVSIVDLRDDLTSEWSRLPSELSARADAQAFANTDVRDFKAQRCDPGTAFVSPANSLGFMDGGIDYVYSRIMFPGVEQRVKKAIAVRPRTRKSLLGRPWLPIGEAIVVNAAGADDDSYMLIAAPTMLMPHNVRYTQNAYYATYASARAALADGRVRHLVLPGMGTGIGCIPAPAAAEQMARALRDAREDHAAGADASARIDVDAILVEQPEFYENTEFKRISPGDIRMH
jgi:O-acetyl-ADP-ribose deacetylase (regulator of RNase III)